MFGNCMFGDMKWTAVLPCKNGMWKKHESIADIFAACNIGSQLLLVEEWVGGHAIPADRGGHPRSKPASADASDQTVP